MDVAAQLPLRGKRAAPVDRHPIRVTSFAAQGDDGPRCATCGRRLAWAEFTATTDMGNGPGAVVPVRFLRHVGRRA